MQKKVLDVFLLKNLSIAFLISFLLIFGSCSSGGGGEGGPVAQKNEPEPEYKLFEIFDDYPALRSSFATVDKGKFNKTLAVATNENLTETKNIFDIAGRLLLPHPDNDKPGPSQTLIIDTIGYLNSILNRIIYQDKFDFDPKFDLNGDFSDNYSKSFYSYFDKLSESFDPDTNDKINLSKPVIAIVNKIAGYVTDKYQGKELEDTVADAITYLKSYDDKAKEETETQVFAKLLLQANKEMLLDNKGNLITDINKVEYAENLGIGNSARGVDALLSGVTDLLKNESNRKVVYDLLRETGNFFAATSQGKPLKQVLKEVIYNLESYMTKGGAGYENNRQVYDRDDETIYSNNSLAMIQREVLPSAVAILMRADRSPVLHDKNGDKTYFLERLMKNMRAFGFDPRDPEHIAAHLEESLYDLIRFDTWGRDRINDPNAWDASFIESVLFIVHAAVSLGWTDGGKTGETIGNDPNANHGHGVHAGTPTLNDCLFSLKTSKALGLLSLYDMVFHEEAKDNIFRCKNYFSIDEKDKFKFYFDSNYFALNFASGFCAGQLGVPQGGNPNGYDGEKLNSYLTYKGNGIGDADGGRWCFELIIDAGLRGEGPYYSTEKEVIDGDIHTYLRPSGKIYARILKQGSNPETDWFYSYPADIGDTVDSDIIVKNNKVVSKKELATLRDGVYKDFYKEYLAGLNKFPEKYKKESQRENRYYACWRGDYLLTSYTPLFDSKEKYCTPNDMSGKAQGPDYLELAEIIPEKSIDRECKNNDESFFRNVHYVLTEKRVALGIPLYIKLDLKTILESFGVYVPRYLDIEIANVPAMLVAQANGLSGVLQLKKVNSTIEFSANGNNAWAKKRDPDDPDMFWYKDSKLPGDYRLKAVLPDEIIGGGLKGLVDQAVHIVLGVKSLKDFVLALVWDDVLNDGTLIPAVADHNSEQIIRMYTPRNQEGPDYGSSGENPLRNEGDWLMGSRKGKLKAGKRAWGFDAVENDATWKNRNGITLLLTIFIQALLDVTEYDPKAHDPTKASSGIVKNPIQVLTDGVISHLSAVMAYYQKEHENSLYPREWNYRILGTNIKTKSYGSDYKKGYMLARSCDVIGRDPFSPVGGWVEREFFRPAKNKYLLNIISDSDQFSVNHSRCDSVLPLLVEYDAPNNYTTGVENKTNTRILTQLFKLLYILGDKKYDDPKIIDYNDPDFDKSYENWGTRRKILYGIEQIISIAKPLKGEATKFNAVNVKRMKYPDWMFSDYGIRACDINTEDDPLIGLSQYPDNRPNPSDWDNFNKFIDALGAFLSSSGPCGNKYNIMENLIDIIDILLTSVEITDDDIKGLRHTLGIVLTKYNADKSIWEYPDELSDVIIKILPDALEVFKGNYKDLLVFINSLLKNEGFLEYFVHALDSSSNIEEIIKQLSKKTVTINRKYVGSKVVVTTKKIFPGFLCSDLVSKHNSSLWKGLAELLEDFSILIDDTKKAGIKLTPEELPTAKNDK